MQKKLGDLTNIKPTKTIQKVYTWKHGKKTDTLADALAKKYKSKFRRNT